jgi:hypothetical protein
MKNLYELRILVNGLIEIFEKNKNLFSENEKKQLEFLIQEYKSNKYSSENSEILYFIKKILSMLLKHEVVIKLVELLKEVL